jgi:signal peptidase II
MLTFGIWAGVVVVLDLVSKYLADGWLSDWRDVPIVDGAVRLVLVHNDQAAFGVSLGAHTWQINCVLTIVALTLTALLCRPLVSIDRWAPVMLGLIAGAAAGNLVSLIASPYGVVDFVAVGEGEGRELVFNLADVAAVTGLVLTVRTVVTVLRVMRAERRAAVMLRR